MGQLHRRGRELRTAEPQLGVPKNRGWYTRGYFPHRDEAGLFQAITYRLADSLPVHVLDQVAREVRDMPKDIQRAERLKRLEGWLDAGMGSCVLRTSDLARAVVETWMRFDFERYDLIAWVVMPNHVHVLIRQYEQAPLGKIVQSWKTYTGKRIAEELRRAGARRSDDTGPVWMRDYWDRFIRNEDHLQKAIRYIHHNPVKAGLVTEEVQWPWSSAGIYSTHAELGLGGPITAEPRQRSADL